MMTKKQNMSSGSFLLYFIVCLDGREEMGFDGKLKKRDLVELLFSLISLLFKYLQGPGLSS